MNRYNLYFCKFVQVKYNKFIMFIHHVWLKCSVKICYKVIYE